jgi:hypothetical protein
LRFLSAFPRRPSDFGAENRLKGRGDDHTKASVAELDLTAAQGALLLVV